MLTMKSLFKKFILIPAIGMGILTLEHCCYDEDCCYEDDCGPYREWGYRPVYSNLLDDIISLEEPRIVSNPSKIYIYKNYLLVNEAQRGVHIIDNTDPRNPTPINFLKIVGNNDVAIKNGVLYADQFDNLVTIHLDSLETKFAKYRLTEVFQNFNYYDVSPDEPDVYYECPNPLLGVVVEWVADSVDYPCYNY